MNELLLIIPAYNEEMNIRKVIRDLRQQAGNWDILVVDDGSSDGTGDICREMGVPVVRHRVNLGLAEAVRTGIRFAMERGYRYVMQFDGDGQHDACAVSRMLATAKESGMDIVIGSRYLNVARSPGNGVSGVARDKAAQFNDHVWFRKRNGESPGKWLGRRLISLCLQAVCGQQIADPTSGMRLMNRRVMERFSAAGFCLPEPDTLAYLIRKGFRVLEIPVSMNERLYGESYLNFPESLRYCFRTLTSMLFLQWMRE